MGLGLLMATAEHAQHLAAHVVARAGSTTELMCFCVSLTLFTSGRSGMAVARPRASLYFIYPAQFGKYRSRSVRETTAENSQTHSRIKKKKKKRELNHNLSVLRNVEAG